MPLKINVKPGEKFVVNGAVMVAGKKGASLVLQNEATILLGKDIMQEEDATSPAKRIYFTILLMYLDHDDPDQYRGMFLELVESFLEATTFKEVRMTLLNLVQDVNEKRFYRALKTCKALIAYEAEIFKIGAPEVAGSN
ncbi:MULTISPECIES: flagellar biosynthesis repressor FlbT [Nisaea]|jgi:flagellar biosynthesis repressor protein FlbT|uniref:flagellar biosynthesis repressor FlbT n=1 Tax=Nisaea TaxID=390876 RepID=UPI00040738A1|nr:MULTISPECIES: flagellar biosynthesis repressor FlbT [Nisaea]